MSYAGVQFENAFYNEADLLVGLGLERIFAIFEIPKKELSEQAKITVCSKLYNWKRTKESLCVYTEQTLRIQRNRINAMEELVEKQFANMRTAFTKMDTENRRRFCRFLQELPRDTHGVYTNAKIRELIGISKSTYYALLNDESYGISSYKKQEQDEEDVEKIRKVREYKGYEKGIRQIYMLMPKVTGEQFSMYRIRRLMNKYGIRTTIRRPSRNRKAMKELIERNRKANLLMRKFRMYRPNEVRLTDVTYLDYGNGLRAYGSASVDPVTGRLICFVVSENNDLKLALDTLEAMDEYPAKSGAILHSDQGMLYMTDDFQTAVAGRGMNQSMSRRGNCWDNAPQESFFGHFKDECRYEECSSMEEIRRKIDDYGVYYNTERGMWERGKKTPVEYEAELDAMDDEQWDAHLRAEEERYLKMKEVSAEKAMQNAKEYRIKIQECLEECVNGKTC